MQHRRTELPVRPAAFCANQKMLDGVDSSHGKFTGNPPTDENLTLLSDKTWDESGHLTREWKNQTD